MAIAPIGPLTNIALLLRSSRARAADRPPVDHGRLDRGGGTRTVSAEFNIYADPEAADVVFRSGLPITMMGLDVTHQALLDRASAAALGRSGRRRRGSPRSSPTTRWTATWSGTGRTTTAIHDAVAIAHLAIPDLVEVAAYHVAVDTTDGPARGRTVCDGLPYRLRRDGRRRTPRWASGSTAAASRTSCVDAFGALP